MLCPVDDKPCPNDLCHGGGCMRRVFREAMLGLCDACGHKTPMDKLADGICEECRDDLG